MNVTILKKAVGILLVSGSSKAPFILFVDVICCVGGRVLPCKSGMMVAVQLLL